MDDGIAALEADLGELRKMLKNSSRPNVQKELQRVIDSLEAELRRERAKAAKTTTPGADAMPPAAAAVAAAADTAAAPANKAAPSAASPAPAAAAAAPAKPVPVEVKSAGPWTEITTFGLDLGGYSSDSLTVDLRLKGVEALPAENVTCVFSASSLDLKVIGLDGKNHRFMKTNLEKDIVPAESNWKVKKNHVILTLKKVKGEYSYDSWSDLVAKGKRKPTSTKKDSNPQDSIMDMMKDLYDDGDDNMKKVIGEAMYKAKKGEPMKDMDSKMPGLDEDM